MKAAQINDYGHTDQINIVEIERPVPQAGQVLIEVKAASLNPFDTMLREGYAKQMVSLTFPATIGLDVAGVVTAVGPAVQEFAVGDEVYGSAGVIAGGSGALAEFATASVGQVSKKPASIDFIHAAAVVLTGQSALQALDQLSLQAGQRVLIHGGSGGIGSLAIQLAKKAGAYVATTATGDGVTFAKQLGADQVIDYKQERFEEVLSDFDAVFDTVAGETYTRSFTVLKKGGVIVSMNEQPNHELAANHGVTALSQMTKTSPDSLAALARHIDAGDLAVLVDKVFSLDETRAAFDARESGSVKGKIVVKISD